MRKKRKRVEQDSDNEQPKKKQKTTPLDFSRIKGRFYRTKTDGSEFADALVACLKKRSETSKTKHAQKAVDALLKTKSRLRIWVRKRFCQGYNTLNNPRTAIEKETDTAYRELAQSPPYEKKISENNEKRLRADKIYKRNVYKKNLKRKPKKNPLKKSQRASKKTKKILPLKERLRNRKKTQPIQRMDSKKITPKKSRHTIKEAKNQPPLKRRLRSQKKIQANEKIDSAIKATKQPQKPARLSGNPSSLFIANKTPKPKQTTHIRTIYDAHREENHRKNTDIQPPPALNSENLK